ncbi:hypothetical protein HPB47_007872 [Ixodes persulcatus]|uniref:Uncharacterized protein n=1 Tax=Ixodes persulcatus TaxID=34615 RepID=A0AC60P6I2_IXOPE|nr:hypothetical protein HPB47_007872 [Ixodes persulcatus]
MSTGEASASSIAMGGKAGGGAGCAVSALRLIRLSYDSSAVRSKTVEALDYVQSRQAQFTRRQLMVSFSMAVIWFWPENPTEAQFYQPGKNCTHTAIGSTFGGVLPICVPS